ncbi:cyclic nucleotide-binding domain-containing protein, partial [Staphylococcus epidermidis]|uniref:cyclic nucleotide-binding domain-containing protein n=1 Tax=Staphylococcus epidermidis TaxID=1282 RepID=UPI000C47798A
SLPRNAAIYGESDPADHLYKVTRGVVRTCKVLIDGRRQIGGFYFSGDTFGAESDGWHVFSAEAVVDTKVLVIRRKEMALLA